MKSETMESPLLQLEDLCVRFPVKGGTVHAVNHVSLALKRGETLGIVGESGCGKTTTGLSIVNLVTPSQGRIYFKGEDITHMDRLPRGRQMALRKEIQVIFQDPFSSLNPRMTLYKTLYEPMAIHKMGPPAQMKDRVAYLLEKVGLTPAQWHRYPHEFSGGQRQRIGIARALCLNPDLIIGDEPVSALDVSIQAQIINLLMDLQREFDLSYVFISHDLAVVEHIADTIAVMYLGRIMETAPYQCLYQSPAHPYTRALLSAVPLPDPEIRRERTYLGGDVPSPRHPPEGCVFHPRCPDVREICRIRRPRLQNLGDGHWVACHFSTPNLERNSQ
ncbi:MAG: ATP-binding cassette domain-containing protein [Desulfobacterales bacterium]|nr:ATP-binding cassette domain-containing protein [Desulfobacterales bacterium]